MIALCELGEEEKVARAIIQERGEAYITRVTKKEVGVEIIN
ncbi:MAG: hypothetical protein QW279_00025 [Candidatus Jordarchaeaceae archaeon]